MNLLKETLDIIRLIGKDEKDIMWVGSEDGKYAISWNEFKEIAEKTNYDEGFGAQEIAMDLVIVFSDGSWLERAEYDGSEWWEYKKTPVRKSCTQSFNRVKVKSSEVGWKTLSELNSD